MNCCLFSGRLTRDAETRYTQNGKAVSNFSLAVENGYGEKKTVVFINCVVWDKEKLSPYLLKGKAVALRGEYTERKWQDRDGNERRTTEINVRDLEFQISQPQKDGEQGGGSAGRDAPDGGTQSRRQDFPSEASGMDDVPFN